MRIPAQDQHITLAKHNKHRIYLLLQGNYDDLMAVTLSLETLQDSRIVKEIAQQLVQGKKCYARQAHCQVVAEVS